MLTVVQRVSEAKVLISTEIIGEIKQGLVILCGFEPHDTNDTLERMLTKCLNYRVFADGQAKMNLSLKDINGGLLLVPQFTLMADTQKGLRPSFSKAASPELGLQLFNRLLTRANQLFPHVQNGCFGADMKVYLCNDGPVTFLLQF